MHLTDIKRGGQEIEDENGDMAAAIRFHQMEDGPINISKNSSDMQFSDLDEKNDVTESQQYNNLLKRNHLIDPSPQQSPERIAHNSDKI